MTVNEFLNIMYLFKKLSGLVETLQEVTVRAQIPLQVRSLFVLYELASSTEHQVVANFFFFFQSATELKKVSGMSSVIHKPLRAPHIKRAHVLNGIIPGQTLAQGKKHTVQECSY